VAKSTLVAKQGLFEVTDGIYQVRGYDLSNISFVEGDSGVIVIDPLISTETAAAALALYREHRGDRPVVAVIYSHSHADHFGGVKGVTSQEDVDTGRVQLVAPRVSWSTRSRRTCTPAPPWPGAPATCTGAALNRSQQGGVGAGLGQTTSTGTVTLIDPTVTITTTGQDHTVDGVRMIFQMAPGTEAPAEMLLLPRQMRAHHRALAPKRPRGSPARESTAASWLPPRLRPRHRTLPQAPFNSSHSQASWVLSHIQPSAPSGRARR
jgi:alkyl sulfatase BDS1-like metallo-beta-lactamase superfamily hydrolase